MFVFKKIVRVFIFQTLVTSCVFSKISFTKWNYFLPDASRLKTMVRISLQECVAECGKRQSCKYVGYMRYINICQLYPSSDTFSRVESRTRIVIGKEDFDHSMVQLL